MENDYKEVYFHEYCQKCKHFDKKESEDPCNECLCIPANAGTHEPVYYKEK